jgi:hypothetical protein
MAGTELPIMCTLSPNSLVDRLTAFETLFAANLTGMEREPLELRLGFAVDAETQVRELFAAEQQCCAFLAFAFERTEAGPVVSITAPADAGPTLDMFQTLAERTSAGKSWTK